MHRRDAIRGGSGMILRGTEEARSASVDSIDVFASVSVPGSSSGARGACAGRLL